MSSSEDDKIKVSTIVTYCNEFLVLYLHTSYPSSTCNVSRNGNKAEGKAAIEEREEKETTKKIDANGADDPLDQLVVAFCIMEIHIGWGL